MSLHQELVRVAQEVPSMRRYIVPLLRQVQGGAPLPDGFDGFDGFEDSSQPARAVDPDTEIRHQVEKQLHGYQEPKAAATFLAPAALKYLASPILEYWNRQAWSVRVKASDKASAQRLGLSIQKNLLTKNHLHSSDPYLYQLPLFVRFQGGWVKLDGLVPKEKAPPTVPARNHLKDQIKQKGEQVFGAGSIGITGKEGAYRLIIKPKLAVHRGVFRETTVGSATLEDLSLKLDQAIQRIQAFLASR